MAYLDPQDAFEHMRDQTLEALKTHFPIKGKTQTVFLDGFDVGTGAEADDIRSQHQKKLEGGSFTVPVHGHLRLVDNASGKVIDQKKLRLVDIPKMTQRYSYIVGGKEYQVSNQWQLKPGAYTKRRDNGELETQFNVLNRSQFDLVFHPDSKEVRMEYKSAKLPVYSLLKSLGVSDAEMERRLGKDVYEANKKARGVDSALGQFYKTSKRADAPDAITAEKHFIEQMAASKVDHGATQLTLGKGTDHVNGESLLRAMEKLKLVQGGHAEDDRDSLAFKNLRSVGDFVADKIKAHAPAVRSRVGRQINTATDLRKAIPPGLFNAPLRDTFTDNAASELATQINPVEMLGKNSQTTVLGPGGIASEEKISDSVKLINQSHMGFQDTVVTPESSRTGVNLRLPLGLKKVGQDAKIYAYNVRTGKNDLITAQQFLTSNVVLPDQINWKNGKPHPISSTVTMAGDNNGFKQEKFTNADYVLRHASQLFSSTTNLIPFLGNVSGNRASMATRHIEQAISLVDRDAPLVQSGTGSTVAGMTTFDEVLGRHAAHTSPVAGTVHSVTKEGVIIRGLDGKKREVQLYNNFPLNDAKSVLHSNPTVKVGDKIHAGQVVADTNYSKNGTLALGKNLTTAYLSFKGYNFEDGLVISETAAKKLSSQHLHKASAPIATDTVLNRTKYVAQLPASFPKARLTHIEDDGVVRVGSKVQPGDPLVLAMRPYDLKSRAGDKAYQKALLGSHVDNSLRWDGEVGGEVVAVHRNADGIQVHVRTIEPAKVGDKLSARSANKGVISMIIPDHEMPRTKDGQIIEIAMSPNGVPGRMNPSQILETAAGKIADKTGKTFIVPNFKRDHDAVAHVQRELKKHGLTDTEEVIDPVSGQSLGQVMVGKQHILKLVHQSDKKLSVASGMGLPGVPSDEKYDANLQSKSGQRLGSLGTYALLAHGAVHNLREMQTFKGEGSDPETDERKKWPTQHLAVWNAIQTGSPLPTPKPTFAFHKFTEMLKGAGINVEKQGHEMLVMPLTDKHILELAGSRVLTRPSELLDSKPDKTTGELRPRAGGLFDVHMTGGHNGKRWSRVVLAEPMPNPIFEAPIRAITGLNANEFKGIMGGTLGVTVGGSVVDSGKATMLGGHAIEHLLKTINVQKALKTAKQELKDTRPGNTDKALKKVKYLRALDELGMTANEAYVQRNMAVIPPALRPASLMQDGNINFADINEIYKNVALLNDQLKNKDLAAAPVQQAALRQSLYEGLKAVSGVGVPYADAEHKGLLHQIHGSSPKVGFFQKRVAQKRQDLSMAAVITPEPSLGLDEVGLPKDAALTLFRPFIVRKLQEMGYANDPLSAQALLAKKGTECTRALEKVMAERPVLLKRDPALHKYSIQGFQPRIVEGNTMKVHPLVCGGFGADFDGDSALGEIIVVTTKGSGDKDLGGFDMPHIGKIAAARVVDLAEFPRIENSATVNHRGVTEYMVPAGTYVPAYLNGEMRMMEVTEYSVHPNCEEWRVETHRGREVICSENHSLAVLDPDTLEVVKKSPREALGMGIPTLRDLSDQGVTKSLPGVDIRNSKVKPMLGDVPLDRATGWFLGATIGDGWVTDKATTPSAIQSFSGRYKEESVAAACSVSLAYGSGGDTVALFWQQIARLLLPEAHFTITQLPHQFEGKDCSSSRVTLNSSNLGRWVLPLIGKGAANKHLPPDFLTYPLECRRGLFCGLLDTDGTVNWVKAVAKNKPQFQCSITTIGKELADGLQLLAGSLGIVSNRTSYMKRDKLVYVVTFSTRTIQDAGWIELLHQDKAANLTQLRQTEHAEHGRGDVVPLTPRAHEELLAHLRNLGAAQKKRDTPEKAAAFSSYTVIQRTERYVTRTTVEKLATQLGGQQLSEYLNRWFQLALNPTLGWDIITSAVATGEKKTMYDLTVPEAWTFTMANGAVVWDTMRAFVPISKEAVQEAHNMKPTKNLFAESSGEIMYQPTLDAALGIYKLSVRGKDTTHKFTNPGAVLDAVRHGKMTANDVVTLNGKKTTAGRILLATALPDAVQHGVLHDLDKPMDRSGLKTLLTTIGKEHTTQYDKSVNALKDMGNNSAFGTVAVPLPFNTPGSLVDPKKQVFIPIGAHTLSLKDLETYHSTRDRVLNRAHKDVAAIQKLKIDTPTMDAKIVERYTSAEQELKKMTQAKPSSPTNSNLLSMFKAGVKPGWDQYKQLIYAPMLLTDSTGRIMPTPVTKSYSEGLSVAGYWTQMHGARRGSVQKVQQVQDPGYFSKLLTQSAIDTLISTPDCGTSKGVLLGIDEKDVHDRILAQDFKAGKFHVHAGTMLDARTVGQIKAADRTAKLLVRSPLRCEHGEGVCQKCAGLASTGQFHDLGTNIGVQAAQTVGERAVQLTLKSFHTGGVASGASKVIGAFERLQQLTNLPTKIPNAATLAKHSGKIDQVEKTSTGVNVFIGGTKHFVGKDLNGHALHNATGMSNWAGIRAGQHVEAGESLSDPSRTVINPHDLYRATKSIDRVQNYLTSEIYDLYKSEGIKRRHVETAVRAMSNLTKVTDPGDSSGILHGEFKPMTSINALNRELMKASRKPVEHTPVLKGIMTLPLDLQEDWMAKLQFKQLKGTLVDAAAVGARSNLHSKHPIPALAYGAEIGLNSTHSNQVGLKHIANVPKTHY